MPQQARLNVRIDKPLLHEARINAIRDGTTLSQVVRDLLTYYINAKNNTGPIPRERQACALIAAAGGVAALDTVRGPVPHSIGFFVWHFTTPQRRGRVRCIFRDDLTGQRIPDEWTLYWIEDPLMTRSVQHPQE